MDLVLYKINDDESHITCQPQLSSLILNFARLLDRDPVDGHRAADLAPAAATAAP